MRLPNPARAVVDLAKLADYCLDPDHEGGRDKARVFASALGIRKEDAVWLRERLLEAAHNEARLKAVIEHGPLYVIDFQLRTGRGETLVRSGWIVRTGEDFPQLTTCYVVKR